MLQYTLFAFRDCLRKKLPAARFRTNDLTKLVEWTRDGRPLPKQAARLFVGISSYKWEPIEPTDCATAVRRNIGVKVTISAREIRTDATATSYQNICLDIWAIANATVLAVANQTHPDSPFGMVERLSGGTVQPLTPFKLIGSDAEPEEVEPEWFGSDDPTSKEFGLVFRLAFSGFQTNDLIRADVP